MNNERERMFHSPIYSVAVEPLIRKLLVPEDLSSEECKECLADLTAKFFDKHQKFVNQTSVLKSDTMWYVAGKSDFGDVCCWHYTWTLLRTKVLGKLACLILSKILGIRTAKCNWKQAKKIKDGDCAHLGPEATSKIPHV
jgi:hypothetical protein